MDVGRRACPSGPPVHALALAVVPEPVVVAVAVLVEGEPEHDHRGVRGGGGGGSGPETVPRLWRADGVETARCGDCAATEPLSQRRLEGEAPVACGEGTRSGRRGRVSFPQRERWGRMSGSCPCLRTRRSCRTARRRRLPADRPRRAGQPWRRAEGRRLPKRAERAVSEKAPPWAVELGRALPLFSSRVMSSRAASRATVRWRLNTHERA